MTRKLTGLEEAEAEVLALRRKITVNTGEYTALREQQDELWRRIRPGMYNAKLAAGLGWKQVKRGGRLEWVHEEVDALDARIKVIVSRGAKLAAALERAKVTVVRLQGGSWLDRVQNGDGADAPRPLPPGVEQRLAALRQLAPLTRAGGEVR